MFGYQVFEAILNICFVLVIVLIAIKHRRISFDHVVIATLEVFFEFLTIEFQISSQYNKRRQKKSLDNLKF